jgi:hypothetical protein
MMKYKNAGVARREAPDRPSADKLLITGVGRGGTTAIATIAREFGYHLGTRRTNLENEDLNDLLARDQTEFRDRLLRLSEEHPRFAFKSPKMRSSAAVETLIGLPNTFSLMIVFRDPLAVTMRNESAMGYDWEGGLGVAAREQLKLVRLAESWPHSLMLISYEKLLVSKREVIGQMAEFCRVTDPEAIENAFNKVEPSSRPYLRGIRKEVERRAAKLAPTPDTSTAD